MRTVIVISRCLDTRPGKINFHFRGFYAGSEVRALQLSSEEHSKWQLNEEYVLYVKVLRIDQGTLVGSVLRWRLLDELTD